MLAPEFKQESPKGDRIDQLVAAHKPGHGLTRPFYIDPEIYERDLERVFRRHWHCIAHESVIPNVNDFEVFRMDGVFTAIVSPVSFSISRNSPAILANPTGSPLTRMITANSPQNTAILLSSMLQFRWEMNAEICSTSPI